ncbi:MAG TPA: hypothetical protein VFQ05_11805 [Candidatus Eisenbacteria bacterium]|nr:hypothetical protein [Candidatus Eisenbacteria bacterium]
MSRTASIFSMSAFCFLTFPASTTFAAVPSTLKVAALSSTQIFKRNGSGAPL